MVSGIQTNSFYHHGNVNLLISIIITGGKEQNSCLFWYNLQIVLKKWHANLNSKLHIIYIN